MYLIAGLGNPGSDYAKNRHNIGFMAVDAVHHAHGFSPWRSRFSANVSEGRLGSEKVLLLKPETFMNLSGQAVGEALRFFKLDADAVTVVHDELDLAPGKVRIKRGGGNGGHNGLKSIDAHIGKEYRRVRLGIGHPGHKDLVSGYVLRDFPKSDHAWVQALCDEFGRSVELLFQDKDGDLNTRLNQATAPVAQSTGSGAANAQPAQQKQRSHIRAARQPSNKQLKGNLPKAGPMADMLQRLLGKTD